MKKEIEESLEVILMIPLLVVLILSYWTIVVFKIMSWFSKSIVVVCDKWSKQDFMLDG